MKSARTKQKKPLKVPLTSIPTIAQAFDRVKMDLIGPLPMTQQKNRHILTVIDSATEYPEAVPMRGKREMIIAENLIKVFSRTGFPKEILSDQDPSFIGKIMKELYHQLDIVKISSNPYHPQTNGLIKNFNGTLKKMLAELIIDKYKNLDLVLDLALFAYRNVVKSFHNYFIIL